MAFSFALLRHRLASRREPFPPALPDSRPEGRLLWAHFGRGIDPTGARLVLAAAAADAPDLQILSTGEAGDHRAPADTAASGAAFLDAWSPDIAVFFGSDPLPAIWTDALRRGIPLIAADADTARLPLPLIRAMARFDAVIAIRPDSRLGRVVEPLGPLSIVPDPPPATCGFGPLRQSIATRPVWLALDVPFAELETVLSAHDRVARLSHRLLLILAPEEPTEVRSRLSEIGWRFATRSADEDPKSEDRILLVDEKEEIGDWLRLAPVTYLGGTFAGSGPPRTPLLPAALGSALVHGPNPGTFGPEFDWLRTAGAVCRVETAAGLAQELERLQSPEIVADLARAGWTVTSANAEASARFLELIENTLAGIDI